jgi:polyisoprenoid-binding protein YceI
VRASFARRSEFTFSKMKLTSSLLLSAALLGLGFSSAAAAETYVVDTTHSSIGFSIKRFFANVPGSFPKFDGKLVFDRQHPEQSNLQAMINVASVNTADQQRDDHLRSPDFFDVAKFPTATFQSTQWKKTGADTFDVTGNFTLHGVTKSIVLKVKSLGFMPGMSPGSTISGWEATTTLKRSEFGVDGPAALGKMLSENVEIQINVTAEAKS